MKQPRKVAGTGLWFVVNECKVDLPPRSALSWQMSYFTGRGRVAHWKPVTPWPRNLLGWCFGFCFSWGRGLSFIFLDERSWTKVLQTSWGEPVCVQPAGVAASTGSSW